jgi:hypothetical protein
LAQGIAEAWCRRDELKRDMALLKAEMEAAWSKRRDALSAFLNGRADASTACEVYSDIQAS